MTPAEADACADLCRSDRMGQIAAETRRIAEWAAQHFGEAEVEHLELPRLFGVDTNVRALDLLDLIDCVDAAGHLGAERKTELTRWLSVLLINQISDENGGI